jgi:uncharacterized peroxidase-related enzyme
MSRIAIPSLEKAPAEARPVFETVNKFLGFVPNLHRLMSLSPPVLNGWAGLMGQLSRTLDVKTRDGIALAVSKVNGCDYCLTAHTFVATNFAQSAPEELACNIQGHSGDHKRDAAAHFVKKLIETRGKVSDDDLAAVREAGFADPHNIEIVALSAQFLFTNFMNNLADTDIDFPAVEPAKAG